MDYEKVAIETIGALLKTKKDVPLVIYPFGLRGKLVKSILNNYYGVTEALIIDNKLTRQFPDKIKGLSVLEDDSYKDAIVLITSDSPAVFHEIREELFSVFPREKSIEIFQPIIDENRTLEMNCLKNVYEKMDANYPLGKWMCYQPKHTRSTFFLPYVFMDSIQQIIFLTDNYFDIANLQYVFNEFQGGIVQKIVSDGVILDIGANIGNHTLYFANEGNAHKVIAFEPVWETFQILQRNILLNHLEHVVELHQCGLGDDEGYANIYGYNYSNTGGTPLNIVKEAGAIAIHSLDSFKIQGKIALIKIDVEGMEIKVLQGATDTIKRHKPYILIESFAENYPKTNTFLTALGYEVEEISTDNYLFFPTK